MKNAARRHWIIISLAVAGCLWNGEFLQTFNGSHSAIDETDVGHPATPVSYAGVARRSTVGVGAPGVGVTPGVGVGAPGVGVAPGNLGGPVNRVGVR